MLNDSRDDNIVVDHHQCTTTTKTTTTTTTMMMMMMTLMTNDNAQDAARAEMDIRRLHDHVPGSLTQNRLRRAVQFAAR